MKLRNASVGQLTYVSGGSSPILNDNGQVAVFAGTARGISHQGTTRDLARYNWPAPDGNGRLSGFDGWPSFNNLGQLAFVAEFSGTDGGGGAGILRSDGTLTQIVRTGQSAPDGDGVIQDVASSKIVSINDLGAVAFFANINGSTPFSYYQGLFVGDGTSIKQIARSRPITSTNQNVISPGAAFALNNAGQVSFVGSLSNQPGIFRGDGNTLTKIAYKGDVAPDGSVFYSFFTFPAMNQAGQVAFRATTEAPGGGFIGLFVGDGTSLTQIARADVLGTGKSPFSGLTETPSLNNSGQVAFIAETYDPVSRATIFSVQRGDGKSMVQIARSGQPAPDGNGRFSGFGLSPGFPQVCLNDAGQVAFVATFAGTQLGGGDDTGLFFYDDNLGLIQVVREGSSFRERTLTTIQLSAYPAAPGSDGLNDLGQIAFYSSSGVLLWSPPSSGIRLVPEVRGSLLSISWPSSATNVTVEVTRTPANAQSWALLPASTVLTNDQVQVTIPAVLDHEYFRLREVSQP